MLFQDFSRSFQEALKNPGDFRFSRRRGNPEICGLTERGMNRVTISLLELFILAKYYEFILNKQAALRCSMQIALMGRVLALIPNH